MKKKLLLIIILLMAAALRLVALDKYPAGLNADEAALGYNAYSLIQTGHDEHGAAWPLVFRSFDDYKPPLYFYLVLPFVKVLGLNVWSVRLPSAFLGIGGVFLIYLLANALFKPKTKNFVTPGHLAAFLLSISPWHLHFSRGGWEANVASVFLLLGIYALWKSQSNSRWYFLAGLSLVASLYAYHSMRIIVPLIGLFFILQGGKDLFKPIKTHGWVPALIVSIILLIPLGLQMISKEGQSRFSGVSIFADSGPYWEALELRRENPYPDSVVTKTIFNPKVTYSLRLFKNYLSHFSPRFLFITGDEIARSKVPGSGQSPIVLAPFAALGVLFLLRRFRTEHKLILFWLLISPLAASLTFQSPHALRAQNMVYPLILTITWGIWKTFGYLARHFKTLSWLVLAFLITTLGWESAKYLHEYYVHYPRELSYAWEYGFDQVASFIKQNQEKYKHIIISDHYDQPYIILAFYLKYPPEKLQKEIKLTPRDKFGFSTVRNFGQFEFRPVNYDQDSKEPGTLIVAANENVPPNKVIHQVYSPSGEVIFKFVTNQ